MILLLNSPEETKKFAEKISILLMGGEVIFLTGNLGSGKTYFTKILSQALGVEKRVKSPTYVLFQKYKGRKLNIYHFDLYRLEKSGESINTQEIGLDEALEDSDGVVLIEWADLLGDTIIKDRIEINLKMTGEISREVNIKTFGEKFKNFLNELKK